LAGARHTNIASIVSVVATNYFPSGGSAYVTLVGSAELGTIPMNRFGSGITNAAVIQQWTALNPGTVRITITVETSDGQEEIGWAHQRILAPN
jgi:hypothetical protein